MKKLLVPVLLALLALSARPSRAETVNAETAALGWQTEHAPIVVLATADVPADDGGHDAAREITLRVSESIRGTLAAGATAVVEIPAASHVTLPAAGAACLVFLAPTPPDADAAPRFRLVSGGFGLRAVDGDGPESRFPGIVRRIAATLDTEGRVTDARTLRADLVAWTQDSDPGIAWSAATDLVRHEELHDGLTDADRVAIVGAYRRCPIGKMTKHALALAAAITRHETAAAALIDTLAEDGAASVRGGVAVALRRLRDPKAETLIAKRIADAPPAVRKNLLVALGAIGTEACAPAVRLTLVDDTETVRTEAARAAGLVARNVREADPEARVALRADLEHAFTNAKSDGERRAVLWALAQQDEADAWAALRRVAADEEQSETVRAAAADYLRAPRVSLLLD